MLQQALHYWQWLLCGWRYWRLLLPGDWAHLYFEPATRSISNMTLRVMNARYHISVYAELHPLPSIFTSRKLGCPKHFPAATYLHFWLGKSGQDPLCHWGVNLRAGTTVWASFSSPAGGYGFDSCWGLKFYSLSHSRVTLISPISHSLPSLQFTIFIHVGCKLVSRICLWSRPLKLESSTLITDLCSFVRLLPQCRPCALTCNKKF